MDIYRYIYRDIYIEKKKYIYILAAYTRHCSANVNMKHYRSLYNFGMVGPLISIWQPKQLSVGVANKKPTHNAIPTCG